MEKKILQGNQRYRIFFFPRKSLRVTHSLDFRNGTEKKKTSCFFFFPAQNFQFLACFFFFLRKSLHCTHSLKIRGRKKKKQPRKKKNNFFTHSLDFCQKVAKNKLFRGKKKYGTFGWGSPKKIQNYTAKMIFSKMFSL